MANADPAQIPPAITESKNKLNAALRYAGTGAGSALTILGIFSFLSPEQIVEVKAQIEIFNSSIVSAYGALTKMWVILGPVAVVMLARAGVKSSTIQALASKLLGMAANVKDDPAQAQAARVELVKAAASPMIGTQAIVNPALAADPATPANVVVSAAAATAIKP